LHFKTPALCDSTTIPTKLAGFSSGRRFQHCPERLWVAGEPCAAVTRKRKPSMLTIPRDGTTHRNG